MSMIFILSEILLTQTQHTVLSPLCVVPFTLFINIIVFFSSGIYSGLLSVLLPSLCYYYLIADVCMRTTLTVCYWHKCIGDNLCSLKFVRISCFLKKCLLKLVSILFAYSKPKNRFNQQEKVNIYLRHKVIFIDCLSD